MNTLIDVRVMAPAEVVKAEADRIAAFYKEAGYTVVEVSPAYPCREPAEFKSRVFMKFMTTEQK